MPSAIDPTFIADGSPVSKPAFRDQLLTLRAELDHGGFVVNPITLAESTTQQALDDVHDSIAAAVGGRVATIADLQALPPALGLVIEVLGYHTPGDGGGGLFYADLTGGQGTDGGTVFGCSADLSAEQSANGLGYTELYETYDLPQGDLAFGTVHLESEEAGSTLTMSDWYLSGHRMNSGGHANIPHIDHKAGRWQAAPNNAIARFANGRGITFRLRYRYFIQPRRWVRVIRGNGPIDVRWFGAQEGTDARNAICWALNAAALDKREVRLNGNYRYAGSIEIPDGVFFGWGSIKLADGKAVPWLRNDYPTTQPYAEPLVATGAWGHGIYPQDGALSWGLIRFELDGSFEGNLEPLQNPGLYTDPLNLVGAGNDLEPILQNTPVWSGVSYSEHSGRAIPEGQILTLEDVHIHGTGSNCLGGAPNQTVVSGRNVRLGNSARNHLFYSLHGTVSGLYLYGFSWGGYGKTEGCTISGLEANQLVDGQTAHDFPWDCSHILIAYEGERYGALSQTDPNKGNIHTGPDDVRWGQRKGLNITGFNIDLEGFPVAAAGPIIGYTGQQMSLSDGTVLGPKVSNADAIRLLDEGFKGVPGVDDSGLYCGITARRIRMFQRGGCALNLMGNHDLHADQSGFVDISIEDARGYEGEAPARNTPFRLIADTQDRVDPKYDIAPRQMHAHRVTLKPASLSIAYVDVKHPGAHPLDMHFSECVFPLSTNTAFKTESGPGGTIAGMTVQDLHKINVFMDRCRFTMGADGNWDNYELFFALTRFRGCATMEGLVSEESGEATLTAAGGEIWLDVTTRLLWAPGRIHITPRSAGAARFFYVEALAKGAAGPIAGAADRREPVLRLHFDQALNAGAVVVLGWDAAVRPF